MSSNTLLFQRISVIVSDVIFYLGAMLLADSAISSLNGLTTKFKERLKMGLFCLLVFNPSLILLDNIHFQYNSMMYGIFCCAIGFILRGRLLTVSVDSIFIH
jgi:alpha-1,3-glucosyltransferase